MIRGYYEQLNANKLDNLEDIDKFLEIYSLPRLNQEEIDNLKRPNTSNEIELVIKKTFKKKKQKCRIGWLHKGILPTIYRRVNTYHSQSITKN